MRKSILTTLGIIALCGLFLAGTVNAYKAGYVLQSCWGSVPTYDGMVSPADEQNDTFHDWLYSGWTKTNNVFGVKVAFTDSIYETWKIEFFTDTTNDAGDYFQLCYDGTANGGAAPQTDDVRIDWVGHNVAGRAVYLGTGSGWAATTNYTFPGDIDINSTLSASPRSATPHWIIEIKVNKWAAAGVYMNQDTWVRVAAYDASNASAGVLTWPPTASRDVPDDWGLDVGNTTDTIQEGLTIGVMVLLSSAAVIVSTRYSRKQPKLQKNCERSTFTLPLFLQHFLRRSCNVMINMTTVTD